MPRSRPHRQDTGDLFDRYLRGSDDEDDLDPLEGVVDYEKFAMGVRAVVPTRRKRGRDDWKEGAQKRRTNIWRTVAILNEGSIKPEKLFDFTSDDDPAKIFTLQKNSRSTIPFQKYHRGQLAIPHRLSNRECEDMGLDELLKNLNSIMGTRYSFSKKPGLKDCLQEYLDESCDFGLAYGSLRPYWHDYNFRDVPRLMERRKNDDRKMRKEAMDGDSIISPNIPPRRIWDLYSNRVLPFHALPVDDPAEIPDVVWAVSHSWVSDSERKGVSTRINGKAWKVPIPKRTDIHNLRIELLNLGAEYVFLDVLCLRQKDGDKSKDYQLKKEWRLDVPTIGYIYQHSERQTIITYFNGLGLPFTIAPSNLTSEFHWLQRVWTLQETAPSWLPGGLTMQSFGSDRNKQKIGPKFYQRLNEGVEVKSQGIFELVNAIRGRKFANRVDQIWGLAYLLRCKSLPIYEPDLDVEDAWDALVEHMDPILRTEMLFSWGGRGRGEYEWRPSWRQLMHCDDLPAVQLDLAFDDEELLEFAPDAGHFDCSHAYYHTAFLMRGCEITPFREKSQSVTSPRGRGAGSESEEESDNQDEDDNNSEGEEANNSEDDIPDDSESEPESDDEPPSSIGDYSKGELEGRCKVKLPGGGYFRFDIAEFRAPVEEGRYALVGLADFKYWIVGEVVGKRRVERKVAYEISKVSVIRLDQDEADILEKEDDEVGLLKETMIVYC